MGSEWQTYALTDLYSVSSGLSKPAKDFGEGHPFVSFKDVFYNFFLPDELSQLVKSSEKEQEKCSVRRGDVFLTRTSETMEDLGMSCVARKDYPKATFNGFSKRLRPSTDLPIHPEYVGYYLRTPQFRNEMLAFSTMSTRASLNNDMIGRLQIPLPPLPEQKAIAHILGTLDDKIELNRRMNATLEGMAQALFKSWFVDFDPVIDNALAAGNPIPDELAPRAEVRKNALANGTTQQGSVNHPTLSDPKSLFPAAFEFNDELGWIPEGWKTDPLGEHLAVLETGRRPKGGVSKYTSGVPSVGAESIFGVGQFNFGKLKFVPEEFFETMKSGKVENYDVLLYKDGGKPGDFKPRAGMFGEGFPFDSFGINEHVFRIRSESLGQPFLYYQISSERVFHHFAVRGGKAAIPGINQQEVKSVEFLIPNEEGREGFNNFVQPIFEKTLKSANQSRMLERLRDTLLPKLISGELRTSEAEQLTEEAIA